MSSTISSSLTPFQSLLSPEKLYIVKLYIAPLTSKTFEAKGIGYICLIVDRKEQSTFIRVYDAESVLAVLACVSPSSSLSVVLEQIELNIEFLSTMIPITPTFLSLESTTGTIGLSFLNGNEMESFMKVLTSAVEGVRSLYDELTRLLAENEGFSSTPTTTTTSSSSSSPALPVSVIPSSFPSSTTTTSSLGGRISRFFGRSSSSSTDTSKTTTTTNNNNNKSSKQQLQSSSSSSTSSSSSSMLSEDMNISGVIPGTFRHLGHIGFDAATGNLSMSTSSVSGSGGDALNNTIERTGVKDEGIPIQLQEALRHLGVTRKELKRDPLLMSTVTEVFQNEATKNGGNNNGLSRVKQSSSSSSTTTVIPPPTSTASGNESSTLHIPLIHLQHLQQHQHQPHPPVLLPPFPQKDHQQSSSSLSSVATIPLPPPPLPPRRRASISGSGGTIHQGKSPMTAADAPPPPPALKTTTTTTSTTSSVRESSPPSSSLSQRQTEEIATTTTTAPAAATTTTTLNTKPGEILKSSFLSLHKAVQPPPPTTTTTTLSAPFRESNELQKRSMPAYHQVDTKGSEVDQEEEKDVEHNFKKGGSGEILPSSSSSISKHQTLPPIPQPPPPPPPPPPSPPPPPPPVVLAPRGMSLLEGIRGFDKSKLASTTSENKTGPSSSSTTSVSSSSSSSSSTKAILGAVGGAGSGGSDMMSRLRDAVAARRSVTSTPSMRGEVDSSSESDDSDW